MVFLIPGGGLGIFTDRDQRNILLAFESRMSIFLGTGHRCCTFILLLTESDISAGIYCPQPFPY